MKPDSLAPRFAAILLILTLSLPSPALAMRPLEKEEAAGLEELKQVLADTTDGSSTRRRFLKSVAGAVAATTIPSSFVQATSGANLEKEVDRLLASLTPEQKVSSLLSMGFVAPEDLKALQEAQIGSVTLYPPNFSDLQGRPLSPEEVARMVQGIQEGRAVPINIFVDAEGGRLQTGPAGQVRFPGNLALGQIAARNIKDGERLTYLAYRSMGETLRSVGIYGSFSPVADLNTNPTNPVIDFRSFGENSAVAARLTAAAVKGLQDAGVAATIKHFPGHGDTGFDSHKGVPLVEYLVEILEEHLKPFRAGVDAGAAAVMSAHIIVKAVDGSQPATLSPEILTKLLRGKGKVLLGVRDAQGRVIDHVAMRGLGFEGVVVSDALEMGLLFLAVREEIVRRLEAKSQKFTQAQRKEFEETPTALIQARRAAGMTDQEVEAIVARSLGEITVRAVLAGADLVITGADPKFLEIPWQENFGIGYSRKTQFAGHQAIQEAVSQAGFQGFDGKTQRISISRLEESVRRLIRMDLRFRMNERPDPNRAPLVVGSIQHQKIAQEVADRSVVLLKAEGTPLRRGNRVAVVYAPTRRLTPADDQWQNLKGLDLALRRYVPGTMGIDVPMPAKEEVATAQQLADDVIRKVAHSDTLVITTYFARQLPLTAKLVKELARRSGKRVILVTLGSMYDPGAEVEGKKLAELVGTVVIASSTSPATIQAIAKILTGRMRPSGRLAGTIPGVAKYGAGFDHFRDQSGLEEVLTARMMIERFERAIEAPFEFIDVREKEAWRQASQKAEQELNGARQSILSVALTDSKLSDAVATFQKLRYSEAAQEGRASAALKRSVNEARETLISVLEQYLPVAGLEEAKAVASDQSLVASRAPATSNKQLATGFNATGLEEKKGPPTYYIGGQQLYPGSVLRSPGGFSYFVEKINEEGIYLKELKKPPVNREPRKVFLSPRDGLGGWSLVSLAGLEEGKFEPWLLSKIVGQLKLAFGPGTTWQKVHDSLRTINDVDPLSAKPTFGADPVPIANVFSMEDLIQWLNGSPVRVEGWNNPIGRETRAKINRLLIAARLIIDFVHRNGPQAPLPSDAWIQREGQLGGLSVDDIESFARRTVPLLKLQKEDSTAGLEESQHGRAEAVVGAINKILVIAQGQAGLPKHPWPGVANWLELPDALEERFRFRVGYDVPLTAAKEVIKVAQVLIRRAALRDRLIEKGIKEELALQGLSLADDWSQDFDESPDPSYAWAGPIAFSETIGRPEGAVSGVVARFRHIQDPEKIRSGIAYLLNETRNIPRYKEYTDEALLNEMWLDGELLVRLEKSPLVEKGVSITISPRPELPGDDVPEKDQRVITFSFSDQDHPLRELVEWLWPSAGTEAAGDFLYLMANADQFELSVGPELPPAGLEERYTAKRGDGRWLFGSSSGQTESVRLPVKIGDLFELSAGGWPDYILLRVMSPEEIQVVSAERIWQEEIVKAKGSWFVPPKRKKGELAGKFHLQETSNKGHYWFVSDLYCSLVSGKEGTLELVFETPSDPTPNILISSRTKQTGLEELPQPVEWLVTELAGGREDIRQENLGLMREILGSPFLPAGDPLRGATGLTFGELLLGIQRHQRSAPNAIPPLSDPHALHGLLSLRRFPNESLGVLFRPSRNVVGGMTYAESTFPSHGFCTLCEETVRINFPGLRQFHWKGFKIWPNPFPAFEDHITLAWETHRNQQVHRAEIRDLLGFLFLAPQYRVFYNGPKVGASVEKHQHFQGVTAPLPVEGIGLQHRFDRGPVRVSTALDYPAQVIVLESGDLNELADAAQQLLEFLDREEREKRIEGYNLLLTPPSEKGSVRIFVFPRRAYLPQTAHQQGFKVGIASIEMGGFMVTGDEATYNTLSGEDVKAMLQEVSVSPDQLEQILGASFDTTNTAGLEEWRSTVRGYINTYASRRGITTVGAIQAALDRGTAADVRTAIQAQQAALLQSKFYLDDILFREIYELLSQAEAAAPTAGLEEERILRIEDGVLRGLNGNVVPALKGIKELPQNAWLVRAGGGLEKTQVIVVDSTLKAGTPNWMRPFPVLFLTLQEIERAFLENSRLVAKEDLAIVNGENAATVEKIRSLMKVNPNSPATVFLAVPQLFPNLDQSQAAALWFLASRIPEGVQVGYISELVSEGQRYFVFA